MLYIRRHTFKNQKGYRTNKGEENVKFPNKVKGNWKATKLLEIVVSDMTCIFHKGIRWEWTYTLDTYNNEIIASSVTRIQNSNVPYYKCLNQLIERVKEQSYPVICTPTKVAFTPQQASI